MAVHRKAANSDIRTYNTNTGVRPYALRVEEDSIVGQPFFVDLLEIVTVFRDSGFVVL